MSGSECEFAGSPGKVGIKVFCEKLFARKAEADSSFLIQFFAF